MLGLLRCAVCSGCDWSEGSTLELVFRNISFQNGAPVKQLSLEAFRIRKGTCLGQGLQGYPVFDPARKASLNPHQRKRARGFLLGALNKSLSMGANFLSSLSKFTYFLLFSKSKI